jgi:hypothetical protein
MKLLLLVEVLQLAERRGIDQSEVDVSLNDRHQRQGVGFTQIHHCYVSVLLKREGIDLLSEISQNLSPTGLGRQSQNPKETDIDDHYEEQKYFVVLKSLESFNAKNEQERS